ncbi:hypothetical protein AGABI2DRAFT_228274 [Agaricus bisporus var. bisporus H97]|uniref:hypothetical protein n=1 Tax=Agaricus bisporus var. bisporus (strain H97 / ATCC MYA-4626 / FGSC 10389) TaxID=936046 RepID=UPI00029F6E58|nr:hypothetical protein AGABI2DRAFT_228274 [Agaricus bisporus var. bisporus H97]EKV42665.1 hypothetical protein AGABI2DRAFT_228274 [Agaricus bisporus var. bisporus H97]
MGKLNIAHHKSYHPYRRDNIERVRRDEEEAKLQEAKEEGRVMLADAEARIDLLRQRAGLEGKHKVSSTEQNDLEVSVSAPASVGGLPTTNGHINLFHDVEQSMVAALTTTKKGDSKTSQEGIKLGPDEKELQRWYTLQRSQRESQAAEDDDDRSKRETQRKYKHDPLTAIEQQLAARPSSSSMPPPARPRPHQSHSAKSSSSSSNSSVQARLQRESSERERARALIQRRKRELEGSMTPSTVYNDDEDGYRDVYNRREVQDAHRDRDRRKHRERRRDW